MVAIYGSIVKGYSLEPNTKPNLFTEANVEENMNSEIGDIRNLNQFLNRCLILIQIF